MEVVKPVIVLPEKKMVTEMSASKPVVSQPKQNLQVIETMDPNRHRKLRTVIMVQSEMEMNEK